MLATLRVTAAAVVAVLLPMSPSLATSWLVLGNGLVNQSPTPQGETRLEGVPFAGQGISFGFVVDTGAPFVDTPGPGGVGQTRVWTGGLREFAVTVGGYAITPTATPNSFFFGIDNGASGPGRLDQLSLSQTTRFGPFSPSLETDAPLPQDSYIHAFAFGRSVTVQGTDGPTFLDGFDDLALDQIWATGAPGMFLTFDVRQGAPTSAQQAAALPRARFSVSQLNIFVVALDDTPAVPEPASWALLIAGFGLTGAAIRRRVATTA